MLPIAHLQPLVTALPWHRTVVNSDAETLISEPGAKVISVACDKEAVAKI